MRTKRCNRCTKTKKISEFRKNKNGKEGLYSLCKKCQSTYQKWYRGENHKEILARRARYKQTERGREVARTAHLKKYNMTPAQYDELLARQDGHCAVCREPERCLGRGGKVKALSVDHDYRCCSYGGSCGRCIRGLVCQRCNSRLGHYESLLQIPHFDLDTYRDRRPLDPVG